MGRGVKKNLCLLVRAVDNALLRMSEDRAAGPQSLLLQLAQGHSGGAGFVRVSLPSGRRGGCDGLGGARITWAVRADVVPVCGAPPSGGAVYNGSATESGRRA